MHQPQPLRMRLCLSCHCFAGRLLKKQASASNIQKDLYLSVVKVSRVGKTGTYLPNRRAQAIINPLDPSVGSSLNFRIGDFVNTRRYLNEVESGRGKLTYTWGPPMLSAGPTEVSDSFDIWRACKDYWGDKLKDLIKGRPFGSSCGARVKTNSSQFHCSKMYSQHLFQRRFQNLF